ncbi:MAG: MobC family plasmid mobilization relaxosome protein [Gammaproteobacteria bacterium]
MRRRRSEKRQRTAWVKFRCTAEEKAAGRERASRAGLTEGAYARAAYLGEGDPGPRAQRTPPVHHVLLREVLGHMGRIGNNVNQIAHRLNADGGHAPEAVIEAMGYYKQVRDAIFAALGMNPGAPSSPPPSSSPQPGGRTRDHQGRKPGRP